MADSRFTALSTDPRYRLPNRKESRTAVDPRFKRLFTDQDFQQKATVDRYGRKIQPGSGKEKLEKLYRLDKPNSKKSQQEKVERKVVGSSDEESEEGAEDEELVDKRDPARDGGFSESSSEEEGSSSGEESEDEAILAEETAGREQTESVPMGEVSHRLAVVNLDWDNIRAVDIMAVASSFAPKGGGIESVAIYPSEFGRERMEKEELDGPPREIFASSKRNEEDSSDEDVDEEDDDEKIKRQLQREQVSEGQEFDTAKLRQYQLDRLRYFYAVITCNSDATARALYDSMDSREYLTSSNFFDLRFIPDGTSFEDDQPRDECNQLPAGYKPNDFRTEALTHSKVRLTWDDDDTTRKEVQKRAFSRAEIDENDLQAYIGSDSSDNESVASRKSAAEEKKVSKKAAEKAKMRAALGLADEPTAPKKKDGKDQIVGDMQITFTSGLGGKDASSGVFENEPLDEESTRARYIRKEKERKQKRKEKMKASRPGATAEADADSDAENDDTQDQGFDDPFFTDPAAAAEAEKKAKKADRQKKRAARAEKETELSAQKAQLDLLMADDNDDNLRHFDMREIEKAQKRKNKKNRKKKDQQQDEAVRANDDFKVETQDPRFKALFESHEYAIDPTNPRFKGTEGMKALLEEGRKKRKFVDEDGDEDSSRSKSKPSVDSKSDLKGLVARLQDGKKGRR